ncbi:Rdx family protein, partial [Salmonella sp. s54836]|uniref:Rdx family protein n=1 Tax=Salmonella sp. s54836 TaxID=3159673 RepID=UPI00397F9855
VQKQLKSNPEIGHSINVVGKRECTATGNFIFTFNGKTIWSKKENDNKFPDEGDISKIVEEIKSSVLKRDTGEN